MPRPTRLELFTRALWLALIPGALLFLVMQVAVHVTHGMVGADSHAYWAAARWPETWYTRPPAHWDAYLYSPAFAQALWPLGQLPWRVFQAVWAAAQVGTLWWLLKPLGPRRGLTLAPLFVAELLLGNLYFFYAAVLVLAVRRVPGMLQLPLLTKIAPGVVGLWFVVRGDWRYVRSTVLVTAAVVAVSVLLDPSAWRGWIDFVLGSSGGGSIRGGIAGVALRLVLAVALVVFAGRSGRAWLLAPALLLACPLVGGFSPLAILAAIPRLVEWQRSQPEDLGAEQHEAVVSGGDRPAAISL
jgi:hypothetical protein